MILNRVDIRVLNGSIEPHPFSDILREVRNDIKCRLMKKNINVFNKNYNKIYIKECCEHPLMKSLLRERKLEQLLNYKSIEEMRN